MSLQDIQIIDESDRVKWDGEWFIVSSIDRRSRTATIHGTPGVWHNVPWKEFTEIKLPSED